jgi:hypothetical protein
VNAVVDFDRLERAVGGSSVQEDPRIDLPLEEQVEHLMALATAQRPEFRRHIPVSATDHDILIHAVLRKFVRLLQEAQL